MWDARNRNELRDSKKTNMGSETRTLSNKIAVMQRMRGLQVAKKPVRPSNASAQRQLWTPPHKEWPQSREAK